MMKRIEARKNLFWWSVGGVLTVATLGTILHFLYDWTEGSAVVKPFSAIDESTFQHMKIMYFPMTIFGLVQWFFFRKEYKCYFVIKLIGILVGLTLIPVLFYTYNGAFGKSPDWLNITIFMVADLCAFAVEYILFKKADGDCKPVWNILAFVGIIAVGVVFVVFTYLPPNLPLFISPV